MPTRKERQLESEATRVRLLEAGLELLRDNPDAAIADVLTARKVYAKAKSSSGGFYEHFHSQQYYVEQLTAYALSMDPVPELDESMKAFLEALADGKGAHEAIISGGAAGLRVADDDMTIPLTLMLRARARPGNLAMRQIQEMYELVNGQAVEPYEAVLAMTHREVRPPYSIRDVVTAITALNEGLQLRRLALPEDVPDESLGSMMLAILELYTRPIGDKRSSSDWIDEIGKDWSVSSSGQRS